MQNTVQIIAHRGDSKEALENTISAIKQALAFSVDYVEFDVRLSKDGIPVVLHDPSAARMTGNANSFRMDELTLEQIQAIDVGSLCGKFFSGEKIPTLFEVLCLDWKTTGMMIEIKECVQKPKVLVEAVFNVLTSIKKKLPKIIIGSFSIEILKEVQSHLNRLNLPIEMIGITEELNMIPAFLELNIKRLALWYKLITPDLIDSLQSKDIDVWTFTVDDLKTAAFLISLGVRGIISNIPKKMLNLKT